MMTPNRLVYPDALSAPLNSHVNVRFGSNSALSAFQKSYIRRVGILNRTVSRTNST